MKNAYGNVCICVYMCSSIDFARARCRGASPVPRLPRVERLCMHATADYYYIIMTPSTTNQETETFDVNCGLVVKAITMVISMVTVTSKQRK